MHKGKTKKRISRPDGVLSVKRNGMRITYDKLADAAYFYVNEKGKIDRTVELDNWLLADVDKKGKLIGIEMLFVSQRAPRYSVVSTLKTEGIAAAKEVPVLA
jgi:uncharacterized protein YuzE